MRLPISCRTPAERLYPPRIPPLFSLPVTSAFSRPCPDSSGGFPRVIDSIAIMKFHVFIFALAALPAWSADELTVYDLLAPSTHSFDIIYDVTATREGAPYFFNPIRPGST